MTEVAVQQNVIYNKQIMNIKSIIKAIGNAVLALLIANLVYFLVAWSKTDVVNDWGFIYDNGVFYLNGEKTGMELWSSSANGLMLFAFLVTLFFEYKKGKLTGNKS